MKITCVIPSQSSQVPTLGPNQVGINQKVFNQSEKLPSTFL